VLPQSSYEVSSTTSIVTCKPPGTLNLSTRFTDLTVVEIGTEQDPGPDALSGALPDARVRSHLHATFTV